MRMRPYLTSILTPPVGACRYGCGSNCAAPVTVFWLFGIVSIVYGFLGGPTGETGISWYTIGLGIAMWGIAAMWTLLTMQGVEADRCQGIWGTDANDRRVEPNVSKSDTFNEVNKAH